MTKTKIGTIDISNDLSVSSIDRAASSAIKIVTIKSLIPYSLTSFLPIILYTKIINTYNVKVLNINIKYILSPILLCQYVYFLFKKHIFI